MMGGAMMQARAQARASAGLPLIAQDCAKSQSLRT